MPGFSENINLFFADFSIDATFGSETAKVIFNATDEVIIGGDVIGSEYTMTYQPSNFSGLTHGNSVTIGGITYTVRNIMKIDEGILLKAFLAK